LEAPTTSQGIDAAIDWRSGSVFCREGEYWTIAYEGRVFRLRDIKGLHCVAYLLHHPGETVAATDLLAVGEKPAVQPVPARDPEHARMAVNKRITAAIKKIAEHHASLGHHLGTCIKTGSSCAYMPDPQHAPLWRL